MPLFVSTLLISVAAVWLMLDQLVRRKFRSLKAELPVAYNLAAAQTLDTADAIDTGNAGAALMPLAVDLARERHNVVPYEDLTQAEQRLVLIAHAITRFPDWMISYASVRLSGRDRVILRKLRQIHVSRPARKTQYFGDIRQQLRLRSKQEP